MAVNEVEVVSGHGFERERCPTTGRPLCRYCGKAFDQTDRRQEFCPSRAQTCKKAWTRFWETRGPKLARLLYAYRFTRRSGALSDLCAAFVDDVDDFDRKRAAGNGR